VVLPLLRDDGFNGFNGSFVFPVQLFELVL